MLLVKSYFCLKWSPGPSQKNSISFISEKIMYLDVLDNKPEQPEGRLVVFMPMNEAATVVYSTAVWWVYSVQSSCVV